MYQILDPITSLYVIDEAHCRELANSSHNYNYNYAGGMMEKYFSSTINSDGATHAAAVVHSADCKKVFEND